jgi:hypothetical protein
MIIQLNISLKHVRSKKTAVGIAEGAAEHLRDTFNDDETLGAIYFKVLDHQPALKARILSELKEWRNEYKEIVMNVSSTEEAASYLDLAVRVAKLIEEVTKS